MNRKYIQPIVQIASELFFFHGLVQVAVCRSNQSEVHTQSVRAAQALEFLILQHTQQLWLQSKRDLTDLVEEECSLVCQFKASDLARHSPRERSLFVPE